MRPRSVGDFQDVLAFDVRLPDDTFVVRFGGEEPLDQSAREQRAELCLDIPLPSRDQ